MEKDVEKTVLNYEKPLFYKVFCFKREVAAQGLTLEYCGAIMEANGDMWINVGIN